MGFKKFIYKMPRKRGIGSDLALDTLQENFDQWMDAIGGLDVNEKKAFEDKFNEIADGAGTGLVTNLDEFKM